MKIEFERIVVTRLSRLEAARLLVDPKEFQSLLRQSLDLDEEAGRVIEGAAVVRALPAGAINRSSSSPRVKKIMRKFRQGSRRLPCPHCEKTFKPGGLNIHLALMHGASAKGAA